MTEFLTATIFRSSVLILDPHKAERHNIEGANQNTDGVTVEASYDF